MFVHVLLVHVCESFDVFLNQSLKFGYQLGDFFMSLFPTQMILAYTYKQKKPPKYF